MNINQKREKFNKSLAVIVRLILLVECGLSIAFTVYFIKSYYYLILLINVIVIIIDGLHVCIKYHGRDHKWYI